MIRKWQKKLSGYLGLSRVDEREIKIPILLHGRAKQHHNPRPPDDTTSKYPKNNRQLPHYLCATAIIKNEGPYLEEWLEFHRLLGIEKFLLYDNGSTDNTPTILAPYIHSGYVELIPWSNFLRGANHQHLAYAHACIHMANKTKWLAVIDADEFLFSPQNTNISSILKGHEHYPAIGVFLYCFGPSGHVHRPDGLVIENYTDRALDDDWQNQQYKSIVQPYLVRSVISAQRFHNLCDNTPAYDEDGEPLLHSIKHKHKSQALRINHYGAKSLDELESKIQREYFWSETNSAKRKQQKSEQHRRLLDAPIKDTDIQRFIPKIKEAFIQRRR